MLEVARTDRARNLLSDSDDENELRQYEHPPGRSSGSGMALTPAAIGAAAAEFAPPQIGALNVSKRSVVQIGPRIHYTSVTQNVHNTEVVKGRMLGLELEAGVGGGKSQRGGGKMRPRRLRCSVAVFVCWAMAVAAGLTLYLLWHYVLTERPERLDIGITEPWYLRRADWQAMPAYGSLSAWLLKLPVRYAIVGHSVSSWCEERFNCTSEVLNIQRAHQRVGWDDIASNFLISGNGLVFEGCGANIEGAMVSSWNKRSVTLMFLGDYRKGKDQPSEVQLQHMAELLEVLVRVGILHPQYTLLGHCQVKPRTFSPGVQIMEKLKMFDHWSNTNATLCLKG